MLRHPTLDKLEQLKLCAMAQTLTEQRELPEINTLSFEERLGLLVDREITARANRRLQLRLKRAHLRQQAALEDLDLRTARGLDRSLIAQLASCGWVSQHLNILICGPAGVGKSYLACALAHKACREGYSALHVRLPRLLQELETARGDGRYAKLMRTLAKVDVLVADDWALSPMTDTHRRDWLEVLEDRYEQRCTILTSQLPIAKWHDTIADPTLADAILDRLVHNAYKINLSGESMRKKRAPLTVQATSA
jgi:DNA replication protein DnaC